MASITLDSEKLKHNFEQLDSLFKKHNIRWSIVTKLLCGTPIYLKELLNLGIEQVCDSRVTNLRRIKSIHPDVETIYIKPPAKKSIRSIVLYSDISLNTEIETIFLLNEEAKRHDKIHKIILMIELGELREGIMGDDLIDFYKHVFELKHIEVVGIGTNLTCMNGILPNSDKLIQLSLYKQLIEAKFNRKIDFISGGSSVTIPLISLQILPKAINHFRIGEALFMGTTPFDNLPFENLKTDLFELNTEIIELIEKPYIPSGEFGLNLEGETPEFDENLNGKTSFRAIIDVGKLDVDDSNLSPVDTSISFVGGSSDMYVIDLGLNKNGYKTGDIIRFKLNYMAILRILNSKYIETEILKKHQLILN